MDQAQRIRDLVAPFVSEAGAELYDLEYVGGVLRITLDKAGGVDIGVIHQVTRAVSRMLDEVDPIPGEYTLEVSSPGLERPLRTPEHFARAVGATLNLKARAGIEGDRRVKGVLVAADADGITVQPEATAPGDTRRFAYADLERARTVFDWGPAPKPGRPTSASSAKKKKAASS